MAQRVRFHANPFCQTKVDAGLVPPPPEDARTWHRSLPGYAPTPLVSLPRLAASLGVREVWLKDESKRFGLNAFKVLGASYAIYRFLKKTWGIDAPPSLAAFAEAAKGKSYTFATATDGNHGRAVAWTAKALGQKAVIFVPGNTVPARIEAIRGEGAEVVVVKGNYDETVHRAASDAANHGWQVISDTAWEGYMEIPGWIMSGYETIFVEATEQWQAAGHGVRPDVCFLQAGVGGLAYAGAGFYTRRDGEARPRLVSVEPLDADCLLESISSPDGSIRVAKGKQDSIMAGLNCGTPSLLAWPLIRASMPAFLAVDDEYAAEAMRGLAKPEGGDPAVVSGESGAAGLAGLLALCREPSLRAEREALGLEANAVVLLISTEGDTDPVNYRRVLEAA